MLSVGYSVIFLCVPMISKNLDSYLIIVLGTSGAREIPAYRAVLGPRHVDSLGAAQGGGHLGSAVMGRRRPGGYRDPAARGTGSKCF